MKLNIRFAMVILFSFFSLHVYGGISFQAKLGSSLGRFGSETTSDFSEMSELNQGMSLEYISTGQWILGLEHLQIQPSEINPFVLADGQSGTFKLGFSYNFITFGRLFGNHQIKLLLGQESLHWTGTIDMSPKPVAGSVFGFEYQYNIFMLKKLFIPVWSSYASVPQRILRFANFPNDKVNIDRGTIFSFGIGLGLGF